MVGFEELYRQRVLTPSQAAERLERVDQLAVPIATGQPQALLHALGERSDFEDLLLFTGLVVQPYALLQRPGVRLISGFYGPIERMLVQMGAKIDFLPADFLGWERYAMRAKPRVVASLVAPMDEHGFFNFGLHSGATFHAFLDAARDPNRLTIAEVNRNLPRVPGIQRFGGNRVHVSEVDVIVESDAPIFELPDIPVTDIDRTIAGFVEELVENGSTIQIGIGGVPNIVAQLLAAGSKGDFGIHTEMMVDGIMRLHQAGKVSNHKGIFDGFSVATFAAGSRDLYRWIDGNPEVRMLPVTQVNDPGIIRRNRKMVSINAALSVDLSGQVMADAIGPRQYSGVGGHELFVMGASACPDGKSIICLHATAEVGGKTVSTIVKALPEGTPVSTPRHHVQYIVTEHGVANLGMLTAGQRRDALIAIAAPEFRDSLRE